MGFLPTSLGLRPRLAIEIRPEGVVAARSGDAEALISAISSSTWASGTLLPGLKPGNLAAGDQTGRSQAVAGIRKALESVALKEREVTLVLPDAAVRVLLLDFDALPAKAIEALPIVRFRLKKLLPFDADDAVISYQVMSQTRGAVRVLAVAIPKGVLAEYESLVREAGFEPGAVLSSTLAACAGLDEELSAKLLVNAGETGVTTAIVQGGVLLLHRTVDLSGNDAEDGLNEKILAARVAGDVAYALPPELLANPNDPAILPLVDAGHSAGEWAQQKPVNGYGVIDDAHFDASGLAESESEARPESRAETQSRLLARQIAADAAAIAARDEGTQRRQIVPVQAPPAELEKSAVAREITQAVSVAAAYFEDTLQMVPGVVMAAGALGADSLGAMLRSAGFGQQEMRVIEAVDPAMLSDGASTTRVPRGWMAGVRGALRS